MSDQKDLLDKVIDLCRGYAESMEKICNKVRMGAKERGCVIVLRFRDQGHPSESMAGQRKSFNEKRW